jgi:cellulose synthase/poly-beta-1,6-N-acetylglucosamine synthase-like glycosyltransferase
MHYLTIFNTIVCVFFVAYFLYRHNRFYLSFERTFWQRKIYALNLFYTRTPQWERDAGYGYAARSILFIPLRNEREFAKQKALGLR